MKLGYITDDGSSFYHKTYPHLREECTWLAELVRRGHTVYQLGPTASPTVMKRYNGVWSETRDMLQHWFQPDVGVIPVEVGKEDPEIDVLMILVSPWINGFNYNGLNEIKKWGNKVDTIIWRVTDYEEYSDMASVLYDLVAKDMPELLPKIKCVLTHDPLAPYRKDGPISGIPHHQFPFLYNHQWEQTIEPVSSRPYLGQFVGPIGFRKEIAGIVPALDLLGAELGLTSQFWGEGYATKYRATEWNFADLAVPFPKIEVKEERVMLPTFKFFDLLKTGRVTFHDSYIPKWLNGISTEAHWISGKIMDAAHAGVFMFSSPTMGYSQEIFPGLKDRDQFTDLARVVATASDSDYVAMVNIQRDYLKERNGIHNYEHILDIITNG